MGYIIVGLGGILAGALAIILLNALNRRAEQHLTVIEGGIEEAVKQKSLRPLYDVYLDEE